MFTAADLDEFIANQTRKDVPWPSTETHARRSGNLISGVVATGWRLSECLLKWSEVDWSGGQIRKLGKGRQNGGDFHHFDSPGNSYALAGASYSEVAEAL